MLLNFVIQLFYHLHDIRCIRKYLSRDSLLALFQAFITSRLDFCNGLLYGLPKTQIVKLQRVQNAAAKLAMNIGKYSHVYTQALQDLYSLWLPVGACIDFEILIAFDEGERFLIQSKSTFLEFLRGIHRYKFGLPKKFFRGEIIQGE